MSFKAEVIADGSGQWVANQLRFATDDEAKAYVKDLAWRWTASLGRRCWSGKQFMRARDENAFPVYYFWEMQPVGMTWAQKLRIATAQLGRPLTLDEMLALGKQHRMTPEEIEAQRQSWARQDKD